MPTTEDSPEIRNEKNHKFNEKIQDIENKFNNKYANFDNKNEFEKYGIHLKSKLIINFEQIKQNITNNIKYFESMCLCV